MESDLTRDIIKKERHHKTRTNVLLSTGKVATPYMGKFWGGKLANLVNREVFVKIFLTNIHRYTENVFGICTDCSLFTNFFSPIAFTCMVHQNFSPAKYFPCTVLYMLVNALIKLMAYLRHLIT